MRRLAARGEDGRRIDYGDSGKTGSKTAKAHEILRNEERGRSMAQRLAPANRKRPHALWSALACAALMAACSGTPNAAPDERVHVGPIRDMANGQDITPASLIDQLLRADAVLLGEQHDNAEHHHLQAWIARELAARGRSVVVAFEMIDESQQPALDGFLAGRPRNAEALGDLLGWERSGWPDWALYRPIADAALTQPRPPTKPIVPANLPLAEAREIARNGLAANGLDTALDDMLRQAAARDPAVLGAHAEDIRDSHCGMLPDNALAPFALAQYARDAVMARAIQAARNETPDALVLLIAGNGHARNDVGVPLHLARLVPGLKVVSVGLIEGETPPETAPFDMVWLTAPLAREDPCEAFRRPAQ